MKRARCLRPVIIAALAFVWGCTAQPPADTPQNRADLAGKLARLAAEHGAFDRVLDEGADLATGATLPALELDRGRSLTDAEQNLLHGTLRSVITEFVSREQWEEIVAGVYAEEFSAGELTEILGFYDKPLGRKLIRLRGPLTERVEAETATLFNARLDEFVERVDAAVATALPAEDRP